MKITLPMNLDDVKELQPVPDGQYVCKVKKIEPKNSRQTGSPMLVWQFVIVEGEFKGMAPFFYNTVLVEQSLFNLKDLLTTLGVEWKMEGKKCVFFTEDCMKREIVVIGRKTIFDRVVNGVKIPGKPANTVDGFLPA
jgi:hypothetical protein